MKPLISQGWPDYELIDSGGREKLERFGAFILRRPEPQALWNKSIDKKIWDTTPDAIFIRDHEKDSYKPDISGRWKNSNKITREWPIKITIDRVSFQLILKLTSSGHIGIFPEQADNWNFIYHQITQIKSGVMEPKVLNLFAYTGAASLAALIAGAEVVHLDAVKQMIDWTEKNREHSGLPKKLHLVVEDTMKFIKREAKRGRKYNGIIMDPPSYGRGPGGEKWLLEEQVGELISLAAELLEPQNNFFVLNWYSMGLSSYVMANIVREYFPDQSPEFGEMVIRSTSGNHLPLGTYLRFGS
jgi:23S rRNA (cytosine1962-C5)-methyltransferase